MATEARAAAVRQLQPLAPPSSKDVLPPPSASMPTPNAPCGEASDPRDLPRLLKLGGAPPEGKPGACSPGSTVASERDSAAALPEAPRIGLRCGRHQIPHPAKASYGGEDACFASEAGNAVGVADGVSEWGWRFGMNPRDFANQLMRGAQAAVEGSGVDGGALGARERAAGALADGHAGVGAFGAATAIVAVLDPGQAQLGVANLGDSGLRQLRRAPGSSDVQIVAQTEEQQHAFNQPFQLSKVPTVADFPRLVAEGKAALVDAMRRCGQVKQDRPGDAALYEFPVQRGDLLLLASDGVFDNLHDAELCEIVAGATSGHDAPDPNALAAAVANAAFSRSQDPKADTPFSRKVKQAGHNRPGGNPDDITVVVAWVSDRVDARLDASP